MKSYKDYYKALRPRIDINDMVKDFNIDFRFSNSNRWDVVSSKMTINTGNEMLVRNLPAVVYEFDSRCFFYDSYKNMPIKVLIPIWNNKENKELKMELLIEQMTPPYKRFVCEKLGRIEDIKLRKDLEEKILEFHFKKTEEGSEDHE